MAKISVTETGIESPRLNKARRLLAEGAVTETPRGGYIVAGDTGMHTLAIVKYADEDGEKRETVACSCRAGSFGNGCSHRLAVELHLQLKRRAA